MQFGWELFFLVASVELLPSKLSWQVAASLHGENAGDKSTTYLATSLTDRVIRCLRARDAVHVALNRVQDGHSHQDALYNLDAVLMNFMSAFDIAARVAHRVLGLSTSERQAAWQHDRWARSVSEVFDGFESVFAEGPDRDALAVLRTLRNSIHGEALLGVAH
jgi:hypothetical protein